MSAPTVAPTLPFLPNTTTTTPTPTTPTTTTKQQTLTAFPSPPPSDGGTGTLSDDGIDFDIESFTLCSPDASGTEFDPSLSFDLSFNASTPSSTNLISPKSTASIATPVTYTSDHTGYPFDFANTNANDVSIETGNDPVTAEALSYHHLQRYLHYKALAEQAEAAAKSQTEQFEALLAVYSMPEVDRMEHESLFKAGDNMLAYQSQPASLPMYGVQPVPLTWPSFTYPGQPQASTTAALHNAHAQAHMQAHDDAMARVNQQRSTSMSYVIPNVRASFDASAQPTSQAIWSRQSASTQSATSPPYPSTPNYAPVPVAPLMAETATTDSLPAFAPTPVVGSKAPSVDREGEMELDDELDEITSEPGPDVHDVKPTIPTMPIANLHGGGRGYVPGETPEDPKKRHKCQICGRGFARAFNLKSHIQTHNPVRSKPHQCPHATCKRGFSRLHDLERHRQGIHSDGPLVDAKRHGVAPAVARAQNRMQRRAETGSLI